MQVECTGRMDKERMDEYQTKDLLCNSFGNEVDAVVHRINAVQTIAASKITWLRAPHATGRVRVAF